jgi:SAM-dependent methyltransferase
MSEQAKSYTLVEGSPTRSLINSLKLFKGVRSAMRDMPSHVAGVLESVREAQAIIQKHTAMAIANLDALEIGPGQLPRQTAYFAVHNRVTGIDLDVIPTGANLLQYIQMLRRNGAVRTFKTIARKTLGYDRAFRAEMARQLGRTNLPKYTLRQMDATRMNVPDQSYDFVYSFDVMEHMPDPPAVIREIVRVLRAGGVSYHSVHPITAEDGFHDAQIISGNRDSIPYWAHLRPAHRSKVSASAFLNEVRIETWKNYFRESMPGVQFETLMMADLNLVEALREIRSGGELSEFSDEELLARRLVAVWRKPG